MHLFGQFTYFLAINQNTLELNLNPRHVTMWHTYQKYAAMYLTVQENLADDHLYVSYQICFRTGSNVRQAKRLTQTRRHTVVVNSFTKYGSYYLMGSSCTPMNMVSSSNALTESIVVFTPGFLHILPITPKSKYLLYYHILDADDM